MNYHNSHPVYFKLAKKLLIPEVIVISIRLEGTMEKNFQQWTEELSKEIFVHTEGDQNRILSRLNEMVDEDYEEE